MPVPPAELTAEFTVEGPEEAVGAARAIAAPTGLAREAGPATMLLSGSRAEVLVALHDVVAGALEAGAHRVDVRLEAPETR